jgi:hypothetical protein
VSGATDDFASTASVSAGVMSVGRFAEHSSDITAVSQ